MYKNVILVLLLLLIISCNEKGNISDTFGNFEATEITISSETNGKLIFLNIEEGHKIIAGSLVAIIDTVHLHLQRNQLQAAIGALSKKVKSAEADVNVLDNQKNNLIRERNRIKRLVERKAATTKQLDDLNGQVDNIEMKIIAIRSQTLTVNTSILAEKEPLLAQITIIDEQISKSYIKNPVEGTILTKLVETHEMVRIGSPLYRIANLDIMTLR